MKITVYNFKGGVGKTSISLNLALDHGLGVVSNDPYSPLERVLDEKQFIKLMPKDDLPSIPKTMPIVFDMGGYVDRRGVEALKQSDVVIVPTINENNDLMVTIEAVKEFQEYNKNIIIVVNRAHKGDLQEVKREISRFFKNNYKVLEIKQSRALPNIFKEKKSIQQMINEGGIKAYMYGKLGEQFANLNSLIFNHKGK